MFVKMHRGVAGGTGERADQTLWFIGSSVRKISLLGYRLMDACDTACEVSSAFELLLIF